METGGYLSHGAIVAREYGIPAVVNVPGLLTVLKDGELIAVDGDEGKVRRQ
jgi:pyruvate,water dikinase